MDLSASNTSLALLITAPILTILFLVIFILIYFKKVKPSTKEGVYFGITLAITGILIDILIRLIGSHQLNNLTDLRFWAMSLIVIAISTITGWIKGRD